MTLPLRRLQIRNRWNLFRSGRKSIANLDKNVLPSSSEFHPDVPSTVRLWNLCSLYSHEYTVSLLYSQVRPDCGYFRSKRNIRNYNHILPVPFEPISATYSPFVTWKLTSFSTILSPYPTAVWEKDNITSSVLSDLLIFYSEIEFTVPSFCITVNDHLYWLV